MDPTIVTPPAVEPVTLAEAKLHLRVDITDDDGLITGYITAARQIAETKLGRTLVYTTYDWIQDGWPLSPLLAGGRYIQSLNMPPVPLAEIRPTRGPLVSVTSITYYDPSNVLQTLDPTVYQVMTGTPGRILPAYQKNWPAVRSWPGSVIVRYIAGYSVDATGVPEAAKTAIKMIIGTLYENREWASPIGNTLGLVPETVDALLATLDPGLYW